jgi:hypothetical protein
MYPEGTRILGRRGHRYDLKAYVGEGGVVQGDCAILGNLV